jgi:hypothetical protein
MSTGNYYVAPKNLSIHDRVKDAFKSYETGRVDLDQVTDKLIQIRALSTALRAINAMNEESMSEVYAYLGKFSR